MTNFNSYLARDEKQKHYVLQVVQHDRKKVPTAKKLDNVLITAAQYHAKIIKLI